VKKDFKPNWNANEVALAIQGFEKYGQDFEAISQVIGSKSELSIRAFYNYYKDSLNLDKLILNNAVRQMTTIKAIYLFFSWISFILFFLKSNCFCKKKLKAKANSILFDIGSSNRIDSPMINVRSNSSIELSKMKSIKASSSVTSMEADSTSNNYDSQATSRVTRTIELRPKKANEVSVTSSILKSNRQSSLNYSGNNGGNNSKHSIEDERMATSTIIEEEYDDSEDVIYINNDSN
jgi:hypothetical protein